MVQTPIPKKFWWGAILVLCLVVCLFSIFTSSIIASKGVANTGSSVAAVTILSTNFHYITTLYRGSYSDERFQEILATVQSNVDNEFIQSVHLLVEEGLDPTELLDSPKVTFTVNSSPTYKDYFTVGNSYGDGLPIIVGNVDVELGGSLGCILPSHLDNTAMVLSRHPNQMCGDSDTRGEDINRCTTYLRPSHDVFIYRAPLPESVISQLDHPQNALGSEVKVIQVFRDSGMKLTNPCLSVFAIHNHCSSERNYARERVMFGKDPLLHVPPSSLSTCASSSLASHPSSLYYGMDEGRDGGDYEGYPALRAFKDAHKGKRCVIVGNAPSLNKMNLTFLNEENTIATNLVYRGFERFGFKPKYYVSVNKHVVAQNFEELQELVKVPKFLPDKAEVTDKTGSKEEARRKGVYLFPSHTRPLFSPDATEALYEGHSVIYVSIQLAYYMGCKVVVLIGVDHRQTVELEAIEASYQLAKDAFTEAGRSIVDATVGGALTMFPKRDYEKYFKLIKPAPTPAQKPATTPTPTHPPPLATTPKPGVSSSSVKQTTLRGTPAPAGEQGGGGGEIRRRATRRGR